jgi:hypothetical protein
VVDLPHVTFLHSEEERFASETSYVEKPKLVPLSKAWAYALD